MTEEVGRKREIQNGSEMAGERRTSRKITPIEYPSWMNASDKRKHESYMKLLVAKWNARNPNATPLVLEELTQEQRAWLKQEHLAREKEIGEAYVARMKEEDARVEAERDPNEDNDDRLYQHYREHWEWKTNKEFGSFEDRTRIPAMCFTVDPMPRISRTMRSMQIFSVKVKEVCGDLHWPLDVFGIIAVRDDLDYNRNVIFERNRDNCQTLNEQDPYLVLTGPVRAPVTMFGPMRLDVILKVRRTNESEDKVLSLIGERYECCESVNYQASNGQCAIRSCVSSEKYKSKLSTLEVTCGIVVKSIEATISVHIIEGSWPDGFSGQFTAFTASVSHMKVSLLKFGDGSVPVSAADGTLELSRCVVSVERFGELRICASAWKGSNKFEHEVSFQPSQSGRSSHPLTVGSCEMEVTVCWSLFPVRYPTTICTSSSNGVAGKVA
ncbi:hypothetical protein QYE76_035139 [Lolium multiflorum]|uniref:DUF6598 domain-containing protein n=1 Tax=Lolium multiflorum TaxID=4521 RepID=A0AAD8VN63_LOLMU|nr:hypothetical protein QYE76_035139 [Lolium multiflorum]